MSRPTYYYPEDVIVENKNNIKTVRLGAKVVYSQDYKIISIVSELPIIYTDDQLAGISNILTSNWLKARENYRAFKLQQFLDDRKKVDAFWVAHRVADYDPKNPKWTVAAYGKDAVTIEKIREWYDNQNSEL
jgi:hypothetical protein